ncbi:hypothetical protein JCM8115_001224 [Rhodotorula mucilaginosa]|uniref:Pseudouridine synthase I TruA alpha/beta domain-containing protein n=1 Tax=Rhodotorula mucilaginosa TaxID=5537 RepID=A0A9P6W0D7_RHOMI|nr:hypothetical protein C6P46_005624 [Rhodotorula mucilaginosa]
MLSPTRATSAAAAPAKPDRARLVAQLKNLEALIAKLDLDEQEQGPDKGKGKGKEDIKLNKRMRKMLARKEQENGPLPPSLANAPKRHVALLFSYEGWAYSGLAYQPKGVYTPLPTVEGTLLAALEKARLIEPIDEGEGFGCGFERCGRTDAGVSSSAQVVNLWVRSDLDDPMLLRGRELDPDSVEGRRHARSRSPSRERARSDSEASTSSSPQRPPKARTDVEIPYVTLLNKHLPPSIRIHAWSPVSATFSSRYSCIWRHYKYFFSTSPAHALLATRFDFGAAYKAAGLYPEHASPDWKDRLARVNWHGLELDVELMKDAVRRLVGEHDFRNFCKVDPPKQLPIHVRTVISATIDPLEGEGDDMFVLNLRGGAFLYNQVRHIVAILFLVGARLEPPSIVDRLLWTSDRTPHTVSTSIYSSTSPDYAPIGGGAGGPTEAEEVEVLDRKPGYQIASDLPLILWQCGFNSHEFTWRTDNVPRPGDVNGSVSTYLDHNGRERQPVDPNETFRKQYLEMRETYLEARLKSIALKHHLASYAFLAPPSSADNNNNKVEEDPRVRYTPLGAGHHIRTTSYSPLLSRQRAELPEVLNARWAAGRGRARMARRDENKEKSDREREANLKIREEAFEAAARRREANGDGVSVSATETPVSGAQTQVKGES